MPIEELILDLLQQNIVYLVLAILLVAVILKGVKIVSQSEKHVIERFGRLHAVLGPGINVDFAPHAPIRIRRRTGLREHDQLSRAENDKFQSLIQVGVYKTHVQHFAIDLRRQPAAGVNDRPRRCAC